MANHANMHVTGDMKIPRLKSPGAKIHGSKPTP